MSRQGCGRVVPAQLPAKTSPDRAPGKDLARRDQAGDHAPWNRLAASQLPQPRGGPDDDAEPAAAGWLHRRDRLRGRGAGLCELVRESGENNAEGDRAETAASTCEAWLRSPLTSEASFRTWPATRLSASRISLRKRSTSPSTRVRGVPRGQLSCFFKICFSQMPYCVEYDNHCIKFSNMHGAHISFNE